MDVRTLQSSTHPLLETSHAQHISPHAVLCPDLVCDQKIIPRVLVDVFFAIGAQSFWVGFARIFIDQVPERAVIARISNRPSYIVKKVMLVQVFSQRRLVLLCAVDKARDDRLVLLVGVFG